MRGLKSQEYHPGRPGLPVIILQRPIGAQVSIKDIHLGLGTDLFDLQRVFDRLGATYAAAIGSFICSGANALDHHDRFQRPDLVRIVGQ